jgi:tol-pal system protein YbgF
LQPKERGTLAMRKSHNAILSGALVAALLGLAAPARAQMSASDVIVRLEQLENQIRQLTGTIEQLQYRNQQLEQSLRRVQDETEFRLQELGSKGGTARPVLQNRPTALPGPAPVAPSAPPPPAPGRRSDVFDPAQNPNAAGAPRMLGNPAVIAAPEPGQIATDEPPIGAPGGRVPGSPLDLSTLASNMPRDAQPPGGQFQPRPQRNPGEVMATLPPTQTPKDEYDLNYGYMLRKDYALAEEGFRNFLRRYERDPSARTLIPDAQYWLGESLFQRQRYQDAADSFLAIVRNHDTAAKAPDSMLRLGQSLAALGERDTACATFSQVGVKYPRASVSVKQGVERELRRVRC